MSDVPHFETTNAHGSWAEQQAIEMLKRERYRIVEQNYRCKCGEIDIVARDGDVLVFVEVRSRTDDEHGHAAEMVTWRKQRQVVRVAEWYLIERSPDFEECRFDVVAITAGVVELVRDAFRSTRR